VDSADAKSIGGILRDSAYRHASGAAILAPGRPPLSYGALFEQAQRISGRLRSLRIHGHDRVALVLPNGPEAASGFLSVAACTGCAPLNPRLQKAEYEFELADVRASALIVSQASPREATDAARSLGIPVLEIVPLECAGEFDVAPGDSNGHRNGLDWSDPTDTALLLHTSGTTSRPKLVPLTGANLAASAAHIAETLALTPADRCLNIMPLFHIHGLVAALLATVKAGASIVCTDGVYATSFFAWMREFRPTWYTAVPTMHQALAVRAKDHAGLLRDFPFRLIRSSSAALAPQLLRVLEDSFSTPVIEAFGMTEAAHQIASNPLPPQARKPGSVGLAAGPEVSVMDDGGRLLAAGQTGEVVVRGANVTRGYEGNEDANRAAFTEGWFRTGDQGYIDSEGYIYLTGRLKELINRGGQKIAPREIDEALLSHPAVRQAVAFAIPHAQLGEDVGAAVEVSPGEHADAASLRDFAAGRLASYKVPRLIQVVDKIPLGPTGKLQRIGLAERLGISPLDDTHQDGAFLAPRNECEERIAAVWRGLLGRDAIGVRDRFEALGGDSLLAARMLATVSAAEGVNLPYVRFLAEGTIEALANEVHAGASRPKSLLVPIQPRGNRPPVAWFPGHDCVLTSAFRLAALLGDDQPIWALDFSQIATAATLRELAEPCARALLEHQGIGSWRLVGLCWGGCLAVETALLMQEAGAPVERLILIDALNPAWYKRQTRLRVGWALWKEFLIRFRYHAGVLRAASNRQRYEYFKARVQAFRRKRRNMAPTAPGVWRRPIAEAWEPTPLGGPAVLVREAGRRLEAPALGWNGVFTELREEEIPFHPKGHLGEEGLGRLARMLDRHLR
jgi:acyl-CoA synthetase (AMP-forming)/AMP-acid ligase II/thioesterase domain-containing protein